MARIKEEGVYRCRLQLDTGHPCIDVIEHYAWDKENKCVDESKPLGGLQVILRADAWKLLDNGELSNTCEELDLSTFGVTIVSPTEYGEEVRKDIVANFVRIFELRDASELLEIASVNPKQLTDAVFDCRAYTNKRGKLSFWLAPAGEADAKQKAFTVPTANKAMKDKLRAKLRVECKGITGVTTANLPLAPTPSVPSAPSASLPKRETEEKLDLNAVWNKWIAVNPDDTRGVKFYEKIGAMYPNREPNTLNSVELSAFCKAHIASTAMVYDDDDENPPF